MATRGARLSLAMIPGFKLIRQVVCFEFFFAFFIFSNALKFLIPPLPVDETLLSAAFALMLAGPIIWREGIYMRGLITVVMFLIFVAYALLSWYWSPSQVIAAARLKDFLMIDLLAIVFGGLVLAGSRERMVRFLIYVALFSVIIATKGVSIYLIYGTFKFYDGFEEGVRVYNRWGYAISLGTVILFALATSARLFSAKQIVAVLGLAICMMFLLVSFSRGSLLCAASGILVFLIVHSPRIVGQRIQINQAQLIALFMIFAAVGFILFQIASGEQFHTLAKFQKLFRQSENTEVVFGPNRFRYYAAAVEYWFRAPIFGHGLGAFSILFYGYEQTGGHPHNFVLELLSDMGIVGLLLFFAFLWSGLRHMRLSQLRRDPLMLGALMLFAASVTQGMFSTDIASLIALYAFTAVLNVRPKEKKPSQTSDLPNLALAKRRARTPVAAIDRLAR